MKKCLWLSRHAPLPAQIETIERMGYSIKQISNTWRSAQEIAACIKEENADVAVIVAPLSLIAALLPMVDIPVLRAEMDVICQKDSECQEKWITQQQHFNADTDVLAAGRHYRFNKFVRLVRIELVTEEWPK